MTGLALLLLAAAASAYGVLVALKSRPPLWIAAPAALLFGVAGLVAVLSSWVSGDGIVLPGLQLSPGLNEYYMREASWGRLPVLSAWLILVGPLAQVLLLAVKRDGAALLRPLPATAVFLWLFLHTRAAAGEERTIVRARGPDRVAYLTIVSREKGARLVLATGKDMATFLQVRHVHDSESNPPLLHLYWTRDGKGVVLRVHEEEDAWFAIDVDGNAIGHLPSEEREWASGPEAFVPPDVKKLRSDARHAVWKFQTEHGGLLPP
jgi:hypothetical protein